MSVFDSVEERLCLLMELLKNASGIWSWCFSGDGYFYYSNCPREQELLAILKVSGCMEYALKQTGEESPFVMGDPTGLLWSGEYFFSGNERRLVVIGPVFTGSVGVCEVQKAVEKYDISIQMKRCFLRIIGDIPVVNQRFMVPYGKMLHYAITMKDSNNLRFRIQSGIFSVGAGRKNGVGAEKADMESAAKMEKDEKKTTGRMTERKRHLEEKAAGIEETLLHCVRTGNRNYMKAFAEKLPWSTKVLGDGCPGETISDDQNLASLRDAKNQLIILISSVAKAAEEGGCPKGRVKELEDYYLKEVEKQETLPGLIQLDMCMLEEFVENVKRSQELEGLSDGVRTAFFIFRSISWRN